VTPATIAALSRLTPRETEVARLRAEGLSTRDIAERLIVSEETVKTHIQHILGKLELRSSMQLAAWFAKAGL